MSSCSLEDIHCAVYSILSGDANLTTLGKVYNNVPQEAVYPYCCIGRIDGNPFLTFDNDGDEFVYNVDIYGVSNSLKNIYKMAKRIKELLSRQEDAISTVSCCVLMFQYGGLIESPNHNMETEGRQVTVEFKVLLLE